MKAFLSLFLLAEVEWDTYACFFLYPLSQHLSYIFLHLFPYIFLSSSHEWLGSRNLFISISVAHGKGQPLNKCFCLNWMTAFWLLTWTKTVSGGWQEEYPPKLVLTLGDPMLSRKPKQEGEKKKKKKESTFFSCSFVPLSLSPHCTPSSEPFISLESSQIQLPSATAGHLTLPLPVCPDTQHGLSLLYL